MGKISLSLKQYVLALILLTTSVVIYSCKKEFYVGEKIDPAILKKNSTYQNGTQMTTVSLAQFRAKINQAALGVLKKQLGVTTAPERLMGLSLAETYKGFTLITDSIKMISTGSSVNYVFPVKLSSANAISFQNLTIVESPVGTTAFVTTYTPTLDWINSWREKRPRKFDGSIVVTPLDLGNGQTIAAPTVGSLLKIEKLSSLSPIRTSLAAPGCTEYTFVYQEPYKCGSGNHWPGDLNCTLTGEGAAGYANITSTMTICTGDGSGGGGGTTTPAPDPEYDPCPKTPPMIDFHGIRGEKLAVTPGTTLCDLQPLPTPPRIVAVDPNARECLKNIKASLEALGMRNTANSAGLIAEVLNKLNLSKGENFNATITEGKIDIDKIAATTWGSDANGDRVTQIKFNETYLNKATDLKIAATMMHEYVHAYFDWNLYLMKSGVKTYDANFENRYKLLFDKSGEPINDGFGSFQHEQIAVSFVETIADMLKTYAENNNITFPADPLYFKKMAWGGLQYTSAYKFAPEGASYTNSAEVGNASTTITQTLNCKK